jgi:hypothetical protein
MIYILAPILCVIARILGTDTKPHFSGDCGNDTSLKPYDQLTDEEHQQIGGFNA